MTKKLYKPRLATPRFQSDVPCKKCNGRERYKTTHACVYCAKAAVYKKRGKPAAVLLAEAAPLTHKSVEIVWDDLL